MIHLEKKDRRIFVGHKMSDNKEKKDEEKQEVVYTFIKGETIDLQPTNSDHYQLYYKWTNTEKVRMYMRNPVPRTIKEIKKWHEPQGDGLKDAVRFEIWHKIDKKPIGLGGLNHINWYYQTANMFMQIGEPEYWNQGVATEAAKLLLDYAFEELNLHKVFVGMFVKNKGSWSVAEKVGFKFEGTLRDEAYVDGEHVDVKKYSLLKEEWLNKEN